MSVSTILNRVIGRDRQRKDAAAEKASATYRDLLRKWSSGSITEGDERSLLGQLEALGVSPDDFKAHLNAIEAARRASLEIASLSMAAAEHADVVSMFGLAVSWLPNSMRELHGRQSIDDFTSAARTAEYHSRRSQDEYRRVQQVVSSPAFRAHSEAINPKEAAAIFDLAAEIAQLRRQLLTCEYNRHRTAFLIVHNRHDLEAIKNRSSPWEMEIAPVIELRIADGEATLKLLADEAASISASIETKRKTIQDMIYAAA